MRTHATILLIFLCLCAVQAHSSSCARIFYMPFTVDTYVPVKSHQIEKRAHHRLTVCEKHFTDKLLGMLVAIKPLPHKENVRVKVILEGKDYYLSNDGICVMGGKFFKFDTQAVDQLMKSRL